MMARVFLLNGIHRVMVQLNRDVDQSFPFGLEEAVQP
jgi:hypothetical protein